MPSSFDAALAASAGLLKQQTDAVTELVTREILLANAGQKAVDAYDDQVQAIKRANTAHNQLAAQANTSDSFQKQLQQAGKTAIESLGQAASFAKGMAAAASPTAWSTMMDSIKLVAMQIGSYFIPAIVRVSIMAQEFADWLSKLSPQTKEYLQTAAYGVAGLYAFSQAVGIAQMMTLGLVSTPVLAGLGLLAVAAAGAAYALNKIADAREEALKRDYASAEEKGYAGDTLHNSAEYKRLEAIKDPEERRKEAAKMLKEAAKAEVGEGGAARTQESFFGIDMKTVGMAGVMDLFGEQGNKNRANSTNALNHTTMTQAAIRELVYGETIKDESKDKNGRSKKHGGKNDESLFQQHQMKAAQPGFSAIEEARRGLQVKALDKDPLEQKMWQMAIQFYEEFQNEGFKAMKDRAKPQGVG
jgi:hypothetical protein